RLAPQDRDVQAAAGGARSRPGALRAAARADRARHRRRDAGRDRGRHRRRADPDAGGATSQDQDHEMIAALVLAAGGSTRMGEPKALLRTPDGRRYVEAIVETARAGGCDRVVVVLGPPHGEAIRASLPPAVADAWNANPERGMLSSVQAGLAALAADAE